MYAFVVAWIVASSAWTMFCIFDAFHTWFRFRRWSKTIARCERESLNLFFVLMDEIREARERIGRDSRPRDVVPNVGKPESQ